MKKLFYKILNYFGMVIMFSFLTLLVLSVVSLCLVIIVVAFILVLFTILGFLIMFYANDKLEECENDDLI